MTETDNYPIPPQYKQIILLYGDPQVTDTVSLNLAELPQDIFNPLHVLGSSGAVYKFVFYRINTALYSDEYIYVGRTTEDVTSYIFLNDGENGLDDPHTPNPNN